MPNPTTRKPSIDPERQQEVKPAAKPTGVSRSGESLVKPAEEKPAATSAKPVETKTEPAANKPVEEKFDWATLAPATEEPEGSKFSRGTKVDIDKEVPEPIRNDVEEAFKKDGKYVLKTCATPDQAERFTKLAKRYAKYRVAGQITVRGGPTKVDPKVVRFNAKTLEKRTPKDEKADEGKVKATSK